MDKQDEGSGNVRLERQVRRPIGDLPLGTRFTYGPASKVWVLLSHEGAGLCAKWEGVDGPTFGQSVCSVAESRDEFLSMVVEVVA